MLYRLPQNPYEICQGSILEQDLLQATDKAKTDQAVPQFLSTQALFR